MKAQSAATDTVAGYEPTEIAALTADDRKLCGKP
jgi:hypothetical protein